MPTIAVLLSQTLFPSHKRTIILRNLKTPPLKFTQALKIRYRKLYISNMKRIGGGSSILLLFQGRILPNGFPFPLMVQSPNVFDGIRTTVFFIRTLHIEARKRKTPVLFKTVPLIAGESKNNEYKEIRICQKNLHKMLNDFCSKKSWQEQKKEVPWDLFF